MRTVLDFSRLIFPTYTFINLFETMPLDLTVTVKMYRVGELGDCFLLHFVDQKQESHVLIDCGSFRNSQKSKDRLEKIVTDIKNRLNGKKLDVVVGTHQHNDHLSGFTHCEKLFTGMVDQVWLSWMDDPKDAFARKIQREQKNLVQNLKGIQKKLATLGVNRKHEVVNDVLGFFGAAGKDPETPAKGLEALKKMGDKEVRYLSPGSHLTLPGIDTSVKVHVLGPARNQKLLFDKDPSKDETFDPHLAKIEASASKLFSALDNQITNINREEQQFPFNQTFKKDKNKAHKEIRAKYNRRMEAWRKIDTEWLDGVDRLALFLDSYTNNSSLVLAFELVKSKKVLLFAADAQTGNWASWERIKWKNDNGEEEKFNAYDLIENTVLYKVGHHASHNATLVKAFNKMIHEELVAMIPVDKREPNIKKKNGWKMPAKQLYIKLKKHTKNRVLRMDDGFADGCSPKSKKSQWKKLPFKPVVTDLFIEYKIEG